MRSLVLGGTLLVVTMAHANRFDWAGKVELDAQGLTSDDPKQRFDAVVRLATDNIVLSQPFLLSALADDDRAVRFEAGRALGMGRSQAAVPALVDWLADPDPRARVIAADALGNIGGAIASQALTRSLGDSDAAVRHSAVRSLGSIAHRGNMSVVASLLPRLDDDKAQVRRETVDQLERLGDKRAVIPLVARFADTSKEVAKAAVMAVGALGDRAAVPALIRALSDADENLRRLAAQSLGRLGAAEAIDALVDQLGQASPGAFRSSVAYALGQIASGPGAGNKIEPAMRILVADLMNTRTHVTAKEALRVAGSAAVPALVEQLASRNNGDLTPVIALLGEIGDARATPALLEEMDRGRVAAPVVLHALGASGDPMALIPVLSATADADVAVRLAAMTALRPLLGNDTRAADVLAERLDDANLDVRVLAAKHLGALHVAPPRLAEMAASNEPLRLRIAAVEALGEATATKYSPPQVRDHPGRRSIADCFVVSRPSSPVGDFQGSSGTSKGRPATASSAPPSASHSARLGDRGGHQLTESCTKTSVAATNALVEILRTGPHELQTPASIALSRSADPAALALLISSARTNRGPRRHEIVRAIGGALRTQPYPAGRSLLRELVRDGNAKVAIAAVCGLAAAGDSRDAMLLRAVVQHGTLELRRVAAWALGELRDSAASALLLDVLSSPDDRLAGTAAWALGEIASVVPSKRRDPTLRSLPTRWLHVARFGGWAAAINSVGALGRALWAQPPADRNLSPAQRSELVRLAQHTSPLTRINAMFALSSLTGDATAQGAIARGLRDDPSPHVRAAAALGLGRMNDATSRNALEAAVTTDSDVAVVATAKTALSGASVPPVRNEWRTFVIVDGEADDLHLRNQAYFVHGPDGLVWAAYTDAQGELRSEHMPAGTSSRNVWPADRESTY